MQKSKFSHDTWYQGKHGVIKKLDGTNYEEWMYNVKSTLKIADAFEIVAGKEKEPPEENTSARESYRKRRATAAHVLTYSCMPNIQVHIRHLEDPKEIWDTLHRRLDFTASQTGRAAILTKFVNARPNAGESIGEYIARLQNYQTQLHGTKEAITDGLLQSRIFESAPSEFKAIITNLRDQPDITVEKIMARLSLDEEERKNTSMAVVVSSGSALYAGGTHNPGRGHGRGRGSRGQGYGRGQGRGKGQGRRHGRGYDQGQGRGHGRGYNQGQGGGPDRRQDNSEKKRPLFDIECYYCAETGHVKRDCPVKHRADEAFRKRQRTGSHPSGQSTALIATNQPSGNQFEDDGGGLIL